MTPDPNAKRYRSTKGERAAVRELRAALKAAGICINASITGKPSKRSGRVHGPPDAGGRCQACREARRSTQSGWRWRRAAEAFERATGQTVKP